MKAGVSWLLLFVLGIVCIVIGVQGSLGKMVACTFTPASVVVTQR